MENISHFQKKMRRKRLLMLIFLSLLLFNSSLSYAVVRYVTMGGNGTKDGSSWADAADDPQAMINKSAAGDEVWVATGLYFPTHSASGWTETNPTGVNSDPKDRNNAFVMKTGVKVYGGFTGKEMTVDRRNWIKNLTILSGDFDMNDYGNNPFAFQSVENAFHVVITANTGSGTVLDGFSIQGGNYPYNSIDEISVNGCMIRVDQGGGIYASNSEIYLCNLEVRRNDAPERGGGLYCEMSSNLKAYNVFFFKNFAANGGAICTFFCNPTFKNVIIAENESGQGAGVLNVGGPNDLDISTPKFINTLIHSNLGATQRGHGRGAGMFNQRSSPILLNCSVVGNIGGINDGGGGIGMYNSFNSFPKVYNTIIWNNVAADYDNYSYFNDYVDNITDNSDCVTEYRNSLVEGMDLSLSGGLNAAQPGFDPMFFATPKYSFLGTSEGYSGTFTLKPGSPCIDAGDADLYETACGSDFTGWDEEYALTPPPFAASPDNYFGTFPPFFGTWYPMDLDNSGRAAPRKGGTTINIGAFEEVILSVDPGPNPKGIRRYVTIPGSGTKDGSSWDNASDNIQKMINASSAGDSIWVAAGTYLPTHSAAGWTESSPTGVNTDPKDQNNAFVMKTGVKVFGGFAGNETDLKQQNRIKNRTILSGDFNGDDGETGADDASHAENAHHVVISAGAGSWTELNGFTVQGGGYFTDFDDLEQDIRVITVNGEEVGLRNGGGIHITNSSVSLQNLDIQGNGGSNGGGIYCVNSSGAKGYNLNIHKNSGRSGGGINVTGCNAKFKNLVISQNYAAYGGGISNEEGFCRPEYLNMMLVNNQADFYIGFGAGMINTRSAPIITNTTIVYNYGGQCAGMINNYAYPVINNSVIWDNNALPASTWYPYVDNVTTWSGGVTYNSSLLQGVDLSSVGGLDATQPGFDLMIDPSTAGFYENSPCIDAGSDALYEAACGSDFLGRENEYTITLGPDAFYPGKETPRFVGAGIDIGACEYYVIPSPPPPPPCDGPGVIRYVTQTGNGTKDGSSWNNASDDIQAMINISDRCDEVWVAKGTYKPTHSSNGWTEGTPTVVNSNLSDQENSFVLKTGVKVYGGFSGNETDFDKRNWIKNKTILSGDFGGNDEENNPSSWASFENAFHVVVTANTGLDTVLDGFTVCGGNCYLEYVPSYNVLINGESVPTREGGGIYACKSAATISNLEIRRNGAFDYGGGLFCTNSSDFKGYNLYFGINHSNSGGGMFIQHSPKFKNIILRENRAHAGGGITIYGWGTDITAPSFINTLVDTNYGYNYNVNSAGAGMQIEGASPTLTNVTIVGNNHGTRAGINSYYSNITLNNSVIWNNNAITWDWQVYTDNIGTEGSTITYNNCLVQGMDLTSSGGLDATQPGFDPMFKFSTAELDENSPCIDAGSDALYEAACGSDFLGRENEYTITPAPDTFYPGKETPRFVGAGIDIGVYEYYVVPPPPSCDGPGVIRYVTQTGNGTKDGSSWNNASDDIQAMINISDRCDEVWVAAGTYLPTYSADGWTESSPTGVNSNPKDQNNAFVMKTGVKVFGGFAGNETDLEQQNWIKNRTILSGDFNGDDGDTRADDASHAENAYHVVISAGAGSDTELNGFTVQGGGYFTNFDDLEQDTRAITVNGEAVGLRNGGGIHVINSSVSLQNLDIQGNGGGDGGGIYCVNSSEARGYNLNIHKNSGRSGGGINVTNCNAKFKNLVVSQNSGLYGGGISNVAGLCRPEYLNMMVVDNQADFYGGFGAGMHNNTSAPIITNATIVYNYGGQCAGMINSVSAYPVINNSIIWDNHALQASNWYPYVDNVCTWSGSVTYNNSLLQDTDLSSVGGLDATQPGFDLMIDPSTAKLYENSPCIDAGSDALYEAACGSDFLGRENEYTITLGPDAFYPGKETPRFVGAGIDIGACEYYVVPPPPSCDGPGVIRYVTQTGNGTKDGSSWNNASDDIQAMINISDRCDEVWAAEGIYTPTHNAEGWTENIPTGINSNSNDRNNAFVMKAGVRVYGGFTGNETDTDQRNWFDDRTILSGDFNNDDDENDYYNTYKENAYHVVIAANIGDETVLDGFTVRGGNIYDSYPGTVINVNGASVASDKGGGIYADNANIKLKNIEIRNNAAPNIGGGLYCVKSSGLRGENLYFYKNFASNGGGIFVSDCSPNFKNIILAENQAGVGAGVSNSGGLRNENGNWISDISSPHYTNVFIHSNIGSPVNGYGAGMQNERSSPVITNSTIAGNYGGIEAAGIYNYYNCNPIVNNSIIWNNSIASGIYNVKDDNDCVTTYNYSVLQGVDLSLSGGLNAAAPGFDPMFISPPGNVLLAPTGSFTLQTGSPCIGAGNPGLYMDALGDEFRGWDDEYALTPPPYTTWKENFTSTFFGTWYPIDDYSGKPALRLYDNQISIGAFETSDIVAFRSAPQAYVQERIELPDKNAGGKCLQMYPNPVFSNSFIQILLPEPSGTDRQNECVRVYNITGSLVLQSAVPAETTTLDLYLPIVPGYYTVKYKNMEAGLLVK